EIAGEGCRRLQLGSGFVVGDEIVATNAHVVAGVDNPFVRIDSERELPAEVIGFDPGVDIALLRVVGLNRVPLPLGDAEVDDEGAILGFGTDKAPNEMLDPLGLDPDPFRINRLITAKGENIYRDSGEFRRAAYLLAAAIESGDSGGPLVRNDGTAVGIVFASSRRPHTAYAVRSSEIQRLLDEPEILGDLSRCAEG
ncbi:MAG: trypsin-like peptidase domain-containing protein, partial [Acidimicrobiales bacterium]